MSLEPDDDGVGGPAALAPGGGGSARPREGSRDIRGEGKIVSVPDDWCHSPVKIVPYSIWAWQSDASNLADTVRQTDDRSHARHSIVNMCFGDEKGSGGGVISHTHNGPCWPKTWSETVRFQDRNSVRHDDEWRMNNKNTWGKLHYIKDNGNYGLAEVDLIKPKIKSQIDAGKGTQVASAAALPLAGAPPIALPGAGTAAGGAAMHQLDQFREDGAVRAAAQANGLDLSNTNDVLAARAFVWGQQMAPLSYSDVPFSGPANTAVAQGIMKAEMAHPGTLGGAMAGNAEDRKRLDDAVKAALAAIAAAAIVRVTRRKAKRVLCHYTSLKGLAGIHATQHILPSLIANNPKDARYGDGQYFSDIPPGSKSDSELSALFIGIPFQGKKFAYYVCIDAAGLNAIEGRPHVFVIPNSGPLPITGILTGAGKNR